MASIRQSTSNKSNASLKPVRAKKGQDNLAWVRANAAKLKEKTFLLLLGGCGPAHVRLRAAQSSIRRHMAPSHWSHVVLCTDLEFKKGKEIAIAPPIQWNFPPASNGVINVTLTAFASPDDFPNVALIGVPVDPTAVDAIANEFWKVRRNGVDAVEMMLRWLGFLWGVEGAHNPLEQGIGVPSAAMVDYVLNAVNFDLTPALNSRSSCPEAIWQSARWWNDYHKADSKQGLSGAFLVRHQIVPE